jgi:L,D-peptidoglycan transpeptidase YkuD (ErfK/YbiS/YcfS/YnhG family)
MSTRESVVSHLSSVVGRFCLRRLVAVIPLVLAALLPQAIAPALGQTCLGPAQDVRRLVLVTAPTMNTSAATAQLFERDAAEAPWRAVHVAEPATLGLAGMAWGVGFRHLARDSEPLKIEGDMRTPAGIYRIGRSFGFDASSRPGYLRLERGKTVCVDDPSSAAYNTITLRAALGSKVHAEDMGRIELYRRGLVIDYPTDAAAKGGSCIFIHVWSAADRGTAGCIALPAPRVAALQDFAERDAGLAVMPQRALGRFAGCLPQPQAMPSPSRADAK